MPARIVVVHDDPDFVARTVAALEDAGYDVQSFTSSMSAIEALDAARQIEMLITRITFPENQPNGVSLALMGRLKTQGLKVLFTEHGVDERDTEGVGELLSAPADPADIVLRIRTMLTAVTPVAALERC